MGFRKDSYATVWEVTPKTNGITQLRISISRKDRETGEYETDFSGFVSVIGTGEAQKAAKLKERDRIKLGDVDVSTFYSKEKQVTYYNFKVFNFELADAPRVATDDDTSINKVLDGDVDEDDLPF